MRIIVLSKAPVVGKVKTRLMPQYTAEQAASLQKKMTRSVLTKVCSAYDDVWLAVDDVNHRFFQGLETSGLNIELHDQGQGSLGERLQKLTTASFATDQQPVLLIGTDSPHVHMSRYQHAEYVLEKYDVVIGPVEDGGYDFIALSADYPDVFAGIDWSSSTVFSQTLTNISNLALTSKALDLSFDLDHAEDIDRAPPHTW
ncbi:MAG: TIGR04282 family arsenosugar biosynthesis glycosyltransferase [Ghiorsea sp.]|nr:TIGR04282 family arsenosugar biosynthesis glycosyltransferase [Ghiorsea sp.]